jgi:tetratricopeptide (TPR) repeat protein
VAQSSIEELEAALQTTVEDSIKVKLLRRLGMKYIYTKPDQAIAYIKKAIELVPRGMDKSKATCQNLLGSFYGVINERDSALYYMNKVIDAYRESDDKKHLAIAYGNTAVVYTQQEEYIEALKLLEKSKTINIEIGNQLGLSSNLSTMASINFTLENFQAAKKNMFSSYILSRDNGDENGELNTLYNLGVVYKEIGILDSAFYFYRKVIERSQQEENYKKYVVAIVGIADVFLIQNQIDSAAFYISKAKASEHLVLIPTEKIEITISCAHVAIAQEKYKLAVTTYQEVLSSAEKLEMKRYQRDALLGLANTYEAMKVYDKALAYRKKYTLVDNALLGAEKQKELKRLEVQFATKEKEQANQLLRQERDLESAKVRQSRQLIWIILIILALVLVISYLLLKQYRTQYERQNTQLKYKLLQNQMNPHFIFNALGAIQSFIYGNEPRVASKYLSSFAKLVRAILENSREEYILLEKELEWLNNYLKLQLLRFDNRFDYEIQLDESIVASATYIPPMLLQPFIENALEHGFRTLDYRGLLEVVVNKKNNFIELEIRDNGSGLGEITEAKSHVSLATKITKERLSILNKNQKEKIDFKLSNRPSGGVVVSFSIPFEIMSIVNQK